MYLYSSSMFRFYRSNISAQLKKLGQAQPVCTPSQLQPFPSQPQHQTFHFHSLARFLEVQNIPSKLWCSSSSVPSSSPLPQAMVLRLPSSAFLSTYPQLSWIHRSCTCEEAFLDLLEHIVQIQGIRLGRTEIHI